MANAIDRVRREYWRLRTNQLQWWRRFNFRLTHRGRDRLCNICGWMGSQFYFSEDGADRRCPACESLPRHRLLRAVLEKINQPKPRARILHVSPKGEKGLARWFRKRSSSYLSIDKGGVWNTFSNGGAMLQMDVTDLRLPDGAVDFVMCSHVLEMVDDDRKALSEIFRVLSPGGVAALPVQLYGATTSRAAKTSRANYYQVWRPGLDYFERYRSAGFIVDVYDKRLADERLLGLYGNPHVPICTKATSNYVRFGD